MKNVSYLLILVFTISMYSCQAQKLVMQPTDAYKLNEFKDRFIGKPLKVLLAEINPQIKTALGNPADASDTKFANISFLFVNKTEYLAMKKAGRDPISIIVSLKRADDKSYPELDPDKIWTTKQTKLYGDMIVFRVGILGND